ncbi:hypothetical protein FHG87_015443 [Trinorchestia longiramus]|nr:hypothetical protein FHG87_015443 [Trinorchestia longiramus]
MYWGGGGEEPPDKVELEGMAAGAAPASASVPHVQQELHNLQEQFAAQQQLLGNLKSKMPQASHQDYATRLAAMRSRLGRPSGKHTKQGAAAKPASSSTEGQSFRTESMSVDPSAQPFEVVLKESEGLVGSSKLGGSLADVSVMSVSDKVHESVTHPQVVGDQTAGGGVLKKARTSSFSEGTSHSKIQLLRKQLDENRTKYERQQRDNKEKKASMEEMKKKMDKLRQELEQRNEFILNLEKGIIPLQSQPTTQQLCQQLLQKDAIVWSLTSRVGELESLCQDQTDRLGEKDCLIESRTEAVALVTKDRDEKILKMMEEMEERERSMRDMQERFTKQEEEWKCERDTLTRSLAEKSSRVAQMEASHRRTESIRFELATRNAELQEKIVALQSDLSDVTASMELEKNKCQQSHNSIQELKQKLCKAEAHGRSKLKGLEKQVKSIKTGQQSGQNILDLHNQIAVLEEEKGNLQLRLVDFDDLKAANISLEENALALKKKLADLSSDLNAKSVFVSSLEEEKIKLVELLNDREEKLVNIETNSSGLKVENERLMKIEAVLRKQVCDLQDKNDTVCEELSELQSEMKAITETKENAPEKDLREELERRVLELSQELDSLKEVCTTQKHHMMKLEEKVEACTLSEQETSEANQRLLSILTDKENALASNAIEIDSWNATRTELDDEIRELSDRCERLQLEAVTGNAAHDDEVKKLQKLLSDKETELEDLTVHYKEETDRLLTEVRQAETLQTKLSEMEDLFDRMESELVAFKKRNSRMDKALAENEKMISSLKTDLKEAQDALDENKERIRGYEQLIKELKSDRKAVEKNAEKLSELQKETEKNLLLKSKEVEKLQKDFNNIQQSLDDTQSHLSDRIDEVTSLTLERESLLQQVREQQSLAEVKQTQIAGLAAEIAAKSGGVSEEGSIVQMSASDADFIKNCYEEMEAKLQLKDKLLNDVQSQHEAVSKEMQKCKSDLMQRETTIQDLTEKLALHEENDRQQLAGVGDLQSSLESEQKARQDLHNNLLMEQNRNEELQSSLFAEQNAKCGLQDSLSRERELREDLQNKVVSDNASWQQQVESLTMQLEQQSQAASSFSAQLAERDQQLAEMQEQFTERDPQLAEVHQRLIEREQELCGVQQQLAEREKQLADVQQQLSASEAQLAELYQKLHERDQRLSEAERKLDAAKEELACMTAQHAEVTAFQSQAAAQNELLQRSNEQLLQMQVDCQTKQAEIHELRSKVESLSAEDDCARAAQLEELNIRQQRIVQLEQEVAVLRSERECLDASLHSQVTALQAELNNLRQSYDDVSSELQVKKASLEENSQKIILLEATLEEMQRSASESEQLTELKHSARSQQEEMALLNQKLSGLEDTNSKLESRRQKLQQELLEEAEQNASLAEKVLSLEDMLSALRNELETSVASKNESISSYEQQLSERDSALNAISAELEAERIRRQQVEASNTELQARTDSVVDAADVPTSSTTSVFFSEPAGDADAASWFSSLTDSREQESRAGTAATSSQEPLVSARETVQGSEGSESGAGDQQSISANVAELQYKLAWYEEQWTPFTTLYNELLQQHEEAKSKILALTALLEKAEFPEIQASSETSPLASASSEAAQKVGVSADTTATRTSSSVLSLEQQQILEQQYASLYAQYEESCRRIEFLEGQLAEGVETASVRSSTMEVQTVSGQRSAASLFAKASEDSTITSTAENIFSAPGLGEQLSELQSKGVRLEEELRAAICEKERLLQENEELKRQSAGVMDQLHTAENSFQQVQAELQLLQQGGNGRVTELEQMVGSAEAEIAKLRGQLNSVQEECNRLRSLVMELEEAETQKRSNAEVQVARMEEELELQRRDNITLRSELEVMEGENSRRSTDLEILESENLRLRADLETANQAAQILEAEKESLVVETQRLERERESLRERTEQSNAACAHSAEQVRTLHEQLMTAQQQLMQQHQQQQQFMQQQQQQRALHEQFELQRQQEQMAIQQNQASLLQTETAAEQQSAVQQVHLVQQAVESGVEVTGFQDEDELDWGSEGRKEVEHIQKSSSQDAFLREEVKSLKEKLIAIEKERNGFAEDLQAAKIKSGRLLQKIKGLQSVNEALQKDVSKLKSKGGLSDLDQALEEEFKAQVSKAQGERDELKQRLEEVVKEKDHIARQGEVLKDANDRLVEMKEDQDAQIRVLKSRNQDLESAVSSMEWKISELEEAVEEERGRPAGERHLSPLADELASSEASKQLRDQVIALEAQLDELSSSNMKVESINKDLNERRAELESENERLLSLKEALEAEVVQLKEANTKADKDVDVYKEAFIEQQSQFEKLTDEKNTLSNDLDASEYDLKTLKSAYNALFIEHEEIKTDNVSMKHSLLTLEGERDRLGDDVNGLTAELEAYRQETVEATVRGLEEEITALRDTCNTLKEELEAYRQETVEATVRGLEEEITALRDTCNTLKEEATEHGAQQAALQDEVDRLSRDLQFSHGLQDDLQTRLLQKEQSERMSNTTVEQLERRGRYCEAEAAAAAKQIQTLTEELERCRREVLNLQEQVRHWQQQSQHLSRQVESADASLSRLSEAGGSSDSHDDVINAELEAALASLHLRDLRCHQLIIEINKLVEERDSLQLRLSSALRSNQELVRRCQEMCPAIEAQEQANTPPSGEIPPPLKTKLEELRELNDEVEQKTMASVPPHPTIITPDYTLTRETQATSSTLINWIMGRTTPRVMHV